MRMSWPSQGADHQAVLAEADRPIICAVRAMDNAKGSDLTLLDPAPNLDSRLAGVVGMAGCMRRQARACEAKAM